MPHSQTPAHLQLCQGHGHIPCQAGDAASALGLHSLRAWHHGTLLLNPSSAHVCQERPSHCHGKAGDRQDTVLGAPGGVTRIVPVEVQQGPQTMESSSTRGPQAPESSSRGRCFLCLDTAHGELDKSSTDTSTLAGTRTAIPWPSTQPGDVCGEEGMASLQLGLGRGELSCLVLILRYHLW